MNKNLVLIFHDFSYEHLGKDPFLVPYYLGKQLNYNVKICFPRKKKSKNLPVEYRGVTFEPFFCPDTKGFRYYYPLFAIWWLLRNYKSIDFLVLFHFFYRTIWITKIFRFLKEKTPLYVKLDIPDFVVSNIDRRIKKYPILKYVYENFASNVSFFSCETRDVFNLISRSSMSPLLKDKLFIMPNGFDDDYLASLKIPIIPYKEKKNEFITVGRLGTKQKNTEMFLEAIAKLPDSVWTYKLIGPIDPDFQNYINTYFERNSQLLERVFFIGNVSDKQTLWEYYNNAKVFVLTSRWESYGLVLNEAARFGQYIVTTNVGAATDILGRICNGEFVKNDDVDDLVRVLARIQSSDIVSETYLNVNMSWSNYIRNLLLDAKHCFTIDSMY